MTQQRFYVPPEAVSGTSVLISGPTANHIKNSLRLGSGDLVSVFDGRGNEYMVRLVKVGSETVKAETVERHEASPEATYGTRVALIQALPKGQHKPRFIVQRGTEVGISTICFVPALRSVARPEPSRVDDRLARWRRVAIETAERCNASIIPEISWADTWSEALSRLPADTRILIAWEREPARNGLKDVLGEGKARQVAILVGPEGGFDDQEVETLIEAGATPFSLGSRRFTTEFAGILSAVLVLYK